MSVKNYLPRSFTIFRKDILFKHRYEHLREHVIENSLSIRHLDCVPDGFLSNDPEGALFHRGFQAAEIPGFLFGYYEVSRDGKVISILPYFVMDFALSTMLPEGRLKNWLDKIGNIGKIKIACVGHPSSDLGHIDGEVTADILAIVNHELQKKAKLIAYKGFTDNLPLKKFVKVPGLPVALLKWKNDYWSELRSNARYQLKKKLKQAQHLRITECDTLTRELAEKIYLLYLNTYNRAAIKFEKLNVNYFLNTNNISKYILFYEGETLIGFCQLIPKKPRVTFRYIGLDYDKSYKYGVYFLLFLQSIDFCLREGYTELESGATSYEYKKLIGSELVETYVYYRHSNFLAHWILDKIKWILAPSASELQ